MSDYPLHSADSRAAPLLSSSDGDHELASMEPKAALSHARQRALAAQPKSADSSLLFTADPPVASVSIAHANLTVEPRNKRAWLIAQFLTINWSNVALVLTVIALSASIRDAQQAQSRANEQAQHQYDQMSALSVGVAAQQLLLASNATFIRYAVDLFVNNCALVAQFHDISQYAGALAEAQNTINELRAQIAQQNASLNTRVRSSHGCGYTALTTGAVGNAGVANGLCVTACNHSPSAHVCSPWELSLMIAHSNSSFGPILPAYLPADREFAWITGLTGGVNLDLVVMPSPNPPNPNYQVSDCSGWSSNLTTEMGLLISIPPWKTLVYPGADKCSMEYPFACCDYN